MHFLSLASLALAASGAAAIAIPRHHVRDTCPPKPATYAEGYLEDYCVYHKRYMAIDCESQHDTPFFDACCHPMLATETLAKNRAPQCDPANRVSSTLLSATQTSTAASATPTASQVLSTSGGDGDDDDDCDDEDDEPTSTASSATPTATADDDDEDCDDGDDEASSSVAHTTSAASHTSVAAQTTETPSSTPAPQSTHVSSTHVASSTSHSATPSKTTSSPPKSTSGSSSSSSGSSDNGPFDGNATFYYQKGNAGACGDKHPDSALIAAMQTKRYGDLSEKSPLCGQQVKITNKNNGKTVTVTIADACPSCLTENDIDLSEGAFTQIATIPEGEVPISWEFV